MTFEVFNLRFVGTSALSMRQNNLIKNPIGLEENGKQFLMGNSIESTVKFTKGVCTYKHNFSLCYSKGDPG